jgi:hypothetical protein
MFSSKMRDINRYADRDFVINNNKSIKSLNMKYIDPKDTIITMAYNMIIENKIENKLKKSKIKDKMESMK